MTAGHIYTSHIKDPLSLKSLERHIEVAPEILQKELVLQNIHLVSDTTHLWRMCHGVHVRQIERRCGLGECHVKIKTHRAITIIVYLPWLGTTSCPSLAPSLSSLSCLDTPHSFRPSMCARYRSMIFTRA